MYRIQAVIFDLDGLMVHSEPLSLKAWQRVLAEFGYHLRERDYAELIGIDADATVNRLRQGRALPLNNDEILDMHYRQWMAIIAKEVEPVFGLFDLIEAIQVIGLKMGVGSNSRSDYVNLVLETIGLNGNFRCVVTSDLVKRGKPYPDIYLAVANCLGVKPEHCLALEDSPAGLRSALSAGMRCVVVPNPDLLHESYDGAFAQYPSLEVLLADLDRVLG